MTPAYLAKPNNVCTMDTEAESAWAMAPITIPSSKNLDATEGMNALHEEIKTALGLASIAGKLSK